MISTTKSSANTSSVMHHPVFHPLHEWYYPEVWVYAAWRVFSRFPQWAPCQWSRCVICSLSCSLVILFLTVLHFIRPSFSTLVMPWGDLGTSQLKWKHFLSAAAPPTCCVHSHCRHWFTTAISPYYNHFIVFRVCMAYQTPGLWFTDSKASRWLCFYHHTINPRVGALYPLFG